MNMNVDIKDLNKVAVDIDKTQEVTALATNFDEIASDCIGLEGFDFKSELQNRFPLVRWLLATSLSRMMRSNTFWSFEYIHKNADGVWTMQVPGAVWTEPPTNTGTECCWVPFDFAKCYGEVPLNLLCLKDCESVFDELVGNAIRISSHDALPPIARRGEKYSQVKKYWARLSFAWFTAYTAILGMDNTYTDILKPFHGLMQILENPAVVHITGANILSGFDQLGCRLALLGDGDKVFVTNPLIYDSIDAVIVPDQNGNLPAGWSRRNGELYFKGNRFLRDTIVPVDMTAGTGEVWMLDGSAVGLALASDLMVTDPFIKGDGIDTSVDNCGAHCDYYYNFGTAINNNPNKLAVITDVPINGACSSSIGDLLGLINPNTLIPNIGA